MTGLQAVSRRRVRIAFFMLFSLLRDRCFSIFDHG